MGKLDAQAFPTFPETWQTRARTYGSEGPNVKTWKPLVNLGTRMEEVGTKAFPRHARVLAADLVAQPLRSSLPNQPPAPPGAKLSAPH